MSDGSHATVLGEASRSGAVLVERPKVPTSSVGYPEGGNFYMAGRLRGLPATELDLALELAFWTSFCPFID